MAYDTQDEYRVIFDPSLLLPPSNLLLKDLFVNNRIILTSKMKNFLLGPPSGNTPPDDEKIVRLLKLWGGKLEDAQLSIKWLSENRPKVHTYNILDFDQQIETFRTEHIIGPLRKYIIDNDPNLQFISNDEIEFVSEEICLALSRESIPIFCTETSSWKIVEIFKKIGANVKNEIIEYTDRKKIFFRENWKKVLSKVAGAAFIWAWGGPLAGMGALGVAGIYIAIEDP